MDCGLALLLNMRAIVMNPSLLTSEHNDDSEGSTGPSSPQQGQFPRARWGYRLCQNSWQLRQLCALEVVTGELLTKELFNLLE